MFGGGQSPIRTPSTFTQTHTHTHTHPPMCELNKKKQSRSEPLTVECQPYRQPIPEHHEKPLRDTSTSTTTTKRQTNRHLYPRGPMYLYIYWIEIVRAMLVLLNYLPNRVTSARTCQSVSLKNKP